MAVSSLFCGLFDGLAEVLVGLFLVVCQSLDDVGYANLQNHVHAALEVEAQSDAHLAAFLESPDVAIDLVVEQRVQIAVSGVLPFGLGDGFCLALEVVSHDGEAQVEEAYQRQQDGENLYKSFVLHC